MTPEREAKERERFEVLASSQDWNIERLTVDFVLDEYLRPAMQKLWEGFLIRAEIAAEVEAENVKLRTALDGVRKAIKATGHTYKEADWNPLAHVEITITVEEARAALAPKGRTE